MTDDERHECLCDVISSATTQELLAIGDIYSILLEEFNNEILDQWAARFWRCSCCGGKKNDEGECLNCDEEDDA
jgi:hypothetical protein